MTSTNTKKLKYFLSESVKNGYSPVCVDTPTSKKVFGLGALTGSGLNIKETKWVPESNTQADKFLIKPGDFLVSRSNVLDKVGRAGLYEGGLENCSYPDLMMKFRVDEEKIYPRFLELILRSYPARKHFMRCASGTSGSMVKITKSAVESLAVPVVGIDTQKEIVEIIYAWKTAIEKTEQLISAKEKHYKWLSYKLLFGQARPEEPHKKTRWFNLPESWELLHIDDIAKEIKCFNANNDEIPVLSCTKHHGLVDSRQYFKKQVFSQDTSKYKVVEEHEFAYATNHIEEGSIGYQDLYPKGLVSPMYTVFKTNDKVDDGFLYKLLKTETYRHIFEVHTSSSVDRRGSLRWNEFKKLQIPLPPLKEQRRIDDLLSLAQNEINLLKQQAECYRQQKRGLMQKLLTGEWRINGK